jgi:phosphoribosylformylglycinamidine synthase
VDRAPASAGSASAATGGGAATVGVVTFPGSNCDEDALRAVEDAGGARARRVWHRETSLAGLDAVILPGGFAHGDYLRPGAIARFSPVVAAVERFAREGGLVLGICNGFQMLTEMGLLPGALTRNVGLRFRSEVVRVRVENARTPFTRAYREGDVLRFPIAHGDGAYVADEATLDRLEAEGRVVFRYVDAGGDATPAGNPNGSARNVAGILNEAGNVLGLMPHPERACDAALGSSDGCGVFASLVSAFVGAAGGAARA